MATRDSKGRLTVEMISPGEAWNNYVNSPQGHNAAAFTPSYLKPDEKRPSIEQDVQRKKAEMEKGFGVSVNAGLSKKEQADVKKDLEKGRFPEA